MSFRVEGDNHGVTAAMIVASSLACCKHIGLLPKEIKWQLGAYTNWNLTMIVIRYLLSFKEWDPFLCVNSIGILFGFKTAFCQGLDENIRKKLNSMNFKHCKLSRMQFVLADLFVHTVPAIVTTTYVIHNKIKIPSITVTYALTLSSWFAFSQAGNLDVSQIYVPHPWKRAWLAAVISMILTPKMIFYAQTKQFKKFLCVILGMTIPLLTTKLDPNLQKKYNFEFISAKANQTKMKDCDLKRASSHANFSYHSLD